jgi:hypothetical protein
LTSFDIQRGRDHGLTDYNSARVSYGLDPVTSFDQITSNVGLQQRLEAVYGDVNNVDMFVGGMAEDHAPGASVGPLFKAIIVSQFENLRDGDRYWYENVFSGQELDNLEKTTLADVIRRNTTLTNLQDNVFFWYPPSNATSSNSPADSVVSALAQSAANAGGASPQSVAAVGQAPLVATFSAMSAGPIALTDTQHPTYPDAESGSVALPSNHPAQGHPEAELADLALLSLWR